MALSLLVNQSLGNDKWQSWNISRLLSLKLPFIDAIAQSLWTTSPVQCLSARNHSHLDLHSIVVVVVAGGGGGVDDALALAVVTESGSLLSIVAVVAGNGDDIALHAATAGAAIAVHSQW